MRDSSLAEFERRYVRPVAGRTLIVGSKLYGDGKEDRRKRYAEAVGLDMQEGDGVDVVLNLEGKPPDDLGPFAHVECMSVLEHSRRPWLMADNIERLMAPGASLFVSVPWVWRYHAYDHDYFRFSMDGLRSIFPGIEWEHLAIVTQRRIFFENPKKYPSRNGENGDKYLLRSETVGFGHKA